MFAKRIARMPEADFPLNHFQLFALHPKKIYIRLIQKFLLYPCSRSARLQKKFQVSYPMRSAEPVMESAALSHCKRRLILKVTS